MADNVQAPENIMESQQGQEQIRAPGNQFDTYQTSLTTRYCSVAMSTLFSQRSRHSTWRKLWYHLAESERALGVDIITEQALDEMRAHLRVTDSDFEIARIEEKRRRHVCIIHHARMILCLRLTISQDVMAVSRLFASPLVLAKA